VKGCEREKREGLIFRIFSLPIKIFRRERRGKDPLNFVHFMKGLFGVRRAIEEKKKERKKCTASFFSPKDQGDVVHKAGGRERGGRGKGGDYARVLCFLSHSGGGRRGDQEERRKEEKWRRRRSWNSLISI